eukprot:g529.t1
MLAMEQVIYYQWLICYPWSRSCAIHSSYVIHGAAHMLSMEQALCYPCVSNDINGAAHMLSMDGASHLAHMLSMEYVICYPWCGSYASKSFP